ncbi:MAG: hypothetical protein R3E79_45805 [Caldilineaceae bacterium]
MATTNAGSLWVFKEFVGFHQRPADQNFATFMKVVLCCANADGEIAPAEREWVISFASALNAPEGLLEELATYPADEDVFALAASSGPVAQSPRAVLYNAIFACAADGAYSPKEQELVRRLGAKFGIDEAIVTQIEAIYWESRRLREKRIALLFNQGMPY